MEKTQDELKTIVRDIVEGKIYTSRVTPENVMTMVWMPILFMEDAAKKTLAEKLGERGFFYEYLEKSAPRGVNGHPIFFSLHYVTSEEADWIDARHAAVQQALGDTLDDPYAAPPKPKDENNKDLP